MPSRRIGLFTFSVAQTIRAPAQSAWQTLTDTQQWPCWGPSVKAVDCTERYIRAGSQGRVQTAIGVWLPFTVIKFDEGKYWRWQIGHIGATGHRVESLTDASCRIAFEVPVIAAPYAVICKIALQRIAHLVENSQSG